METSSHLRTTLPIPAKLVAIALGLLVPTSFFVTWSVRNWQMGQSQAAVLTEPYFLSIGLGRCLGAILLAVLLVYVRRPASLVATILAVWLAGPPLTFLLRGIDLLAVSGGQSAWTKASLEWVGSAALFPGLVTAALLIPQSVRRAYGIEREAIDFGSHEQM